MAGSTGHPGATKPGKRLRGSAWGRQFLGTGDDYLSLPGVLEVWPAHPGPGCVTLVVANGTASALARYLEPFLPIGTQLYVLNEEEARAITG